MKIAILCYSHYDATIELGKYLHLLDDTLEIDFIFLLCQAKSVNVEIIDFKGKSFDNGFVTDEDVRNTLDSEIFRYLGPRIGLKIFLFKSVKLADLANYKSLIQLKKYIVAKQYNILHFVGNNPWIVFLNCIISKIPKIHTIHEPYPFSHMNRYRLLRHKLNVKLLIHSNSHLIVPSIVSYNRLMANYKVGANKVSIIPFGVFEIYKEYLDGNIVKSNNLILFYGHIDEYKGIDGLIKAMDKISEINSDLKLIIAGGGGSIDYGKSKKNKNITIINRYLSNKEIAGLNQMATVVVCPYTSASQSGVVMTSFAFCNPIVATNVGALAEFVESGVTGIIIEPGSSEILYKTLIDLFKDPAAIEKMRENILNRYFNSEKSWPNIADETFKLYKKRLERLRR